MVYLAITIYFSYTIQSKSIISIYQAHRAPGALTCRMVSEGRLTSNEIASNSDYDSMPRKPSVPLGKKTLSLLPTTSRDLGSTAAPATCWRLNAQLWQLSQPTIAVSSTAQRTLPRKDVSSRDTDPRSIWMNR